jgi:hypothetical protein
MADLIEADPERRRLALERLAAGEIEVGEDNSIEILAEDSRKRKKPKKAKKPK